MKYEFDGISTEYYNPQDKDNFVEYFDGMFIEKSNFTVELEDKEVKLHLYIQDTDLSEFEDSTDHVISIGVVPSFESLSKEKQQSILDQFSPEEQESIKSDAIGLLFEVVNYGYCITLHNVTVSDTDKIEHTIESAIAVRSAVSGLIGFELDKMVNRIGNTGWDYLDDYCCDKDILQVALSRYGQ